MRIFVVIGKTGEYSDYQDWIVCAYADENKAKSRVTELEQLLVYCGGGSCDVEGSKRKEIRDAMRKAEHGDQFFKIDYTGTRYGYEATELLDA